jgi:hypothetical protein
MVHHNFCRGVNKGSSQPLIQSLVVTLKSPETKLDHAPIINFVDTAVLYSLLAFNSIRTLSSFATNHCVHTKSQLMYKAHILFSKYAKEYHQFSSQSMMTSFDW